MASDPRFIGLPDAEIERLAKLPLVTRAQIFGKAEQWYEQNKARLMHEHKGKYLVLNAADLTYEVGNDYVDTHRKYEARYGPTPRNGRPVFCVIL